MTAQAPQIADAANAAATTENITSSTLVKSGPGRVFTVTTVVSGSTATTANDAATTGAAAASNQIGTVAANSTVPVLFGGVPFSNGLVIVPGTGATVAVSFA
jgi:hypothetical protein